MQHDILNMVYNTPFSADRIFSTARSEYVNDNLSTFIREIDNMDDDKILSSDTDEIIDNLKSEILN